MPARVLSELQRLYNAVEASIQDIEERLDLQWEIQTIKKNIPVYVGHLARGYHETNNKARVLEQLHPHEFVEICDWKMKWMMLLLRETQVNSNLTLTLNPTLTLTLNPNPNHGPNSNPLSNPILCHNSYQVDFFGKAGTCWHGCMYMMADPDDRFFPLPS
jgi:hypothetical protein